MMFLQIASEVAIKKVTSHTSHSYAMAIKPCFNFPPEILEQCLLEWSRSVKDMPCTYHLKDVNNRNTFFDNDSHIQ